MRFSTGLNLASSCSRVTCPCRNSCHAAKTLRTILRPRLPIAPHLTHEEIARRYRACRGGVEKTHWQALWLLTRPGDLPSPAAVAPQLGLSPATVALTPDEEYVGLILERILSIALGHAARAGGRSRADGLRPRLRRRDQTDRARP